MPKISLQSSLLGLYYILSLTIYRNWAVFICTITSNTTITLSGFNATQIAHIALQSCKSNKGKFTQNAFCVPLHCISIVFLCEYETDECVRSLHSQVLQHMTWVQFRGCNLRTQTSKSAKATFSSCCCDAFSFGIQTSKHAAAKLRHSRGSKHATLVQILLNVPLEHMCVCVCVSTT